MYLPVTVRQKQLFKSFYNDLTPIIILRKGSGIFFLIYIQGLEKLLQAPYLGLILAALIMGGWQLGLPSYWSEVIKMRQSRSSMLLRVQTLKLNLKQLPSLGRNTKYWKSKPRSMQPIFCYVLFSILFAFVQQYLPI